MSIIAPAALSPFDAIRRVDETDREYWSARELMPFLGYSKWANFHRVIEQAMTAASLTGVDVDRNFPATGKVSGTRGPSQVDYEMSRYGAYLTAMRGDSHKREIAEALTYFAIRTREAETFAAVELAAPVAPRELAAAGGPVSYKEQAEILSILSSLLPASYVAATGKIIVARSMGERPALDPSETPLYASTFLSQKGHRAKTVAKFQKPFGLRVSNAYLKLNGRRPEKIPGPADSRIATVAVYTEDDRPLLEQVYAGIADMVALFEDAGQLALIGGAA